MTRLASAAVQQYHRDGFYFPLRVMTPADALGLRRRLEAVEAEHGGRLTGELRHKPHLLFTWLADLVRHPAILDAVEDVLGPNLLVWSTSFFIKEARDAAYVSWHQDSTYWGLSAPDVLTAWVAFTEATVENGAMRMVPGSHAEQLVHRDTFAPNNLLSRGQEIAVEVDESLAINFVLQPGEFSLHHIGIVHGSGPNTSDASRIGLAVRYVSPDVVQEGRARDMVLLARGRDDYGHFDIVDPPVHDLPFGQSAVHAESMARRMSNVMPATAGGPTGAGGETKAGGQLKEDG